jgi:hypothetical protein
MGLARWARPGVTKALEVIQKEMDITMALLRRTRREDFEGRWADHNLLVLARRISRRRADALDDRLAMPPFRWSRPRPRARG